MKQTINSLLVLFLFYGIAGCANPQVTVTSEVTVTLTPSPTQTLIPTPTHTPETLSQDFIDLQEKFAETEIYTLTPLAIEMKTEEGIKPVENIKPNTKDGTFTITYEGEEYVANFRIIKESKITFTYKDGNIVLDSENLKVMPFEIMELSVDPNKPSVCTAEDYFSGQVAWNERRNAKPFPADAVNTGWGNSKISGSGGLYLQPGSINAVQLSSICTIPGDFLGTENLYDIVGVQVLNLDGSTGFLHFLTDRRAKYNFNPKYIIEQMKKGEFGIRKKILDGNIIETQNDSINGPINRLYIEQGGNQRIRDLITKMILSNAIPTEMETILLMFSEYDPRN